MKIKNNLMCIDVQTNHIVIGYREQSNVSAQRGSRSNYNPFNVIQ